MITSNDVPAKGQSAAQVMNPKEEPFPPEGAAKKGGRKKQQSIEMPDGKLLLKMISNNPSYTIHDGTVFSQEHPYQFVPQAEAELLLLHERHNFRKATAEELLEFYNNQ